MATYLIDYENVHQHGLAGIEKLTASDWLVIFIGNKDKTIPVDAVIKISRSQAKAVWKRSEKTASNYLDIQLASYLGSLVGEGKGDEFHIVSKDQGFAAAVDFWTPRKPNMKFTLQETVEGKTILETSSKQPVQQKQNSVQQKQNHVINDGKIKPSIKKKASVILTSHNLIGGNYTRVYEIFKKSITEQQFLSAMKTAYAGEKHKQLGTELLPVFKTYLSDLKGAK